MPVSVRLSPHFAEYTDVQIRSIESRYSRVRKTSGKIASSNIFNMTDEDWSDCELDLLIAMSIGNVDSEVSSWNIQRLLAEIYIESGTSRDVGWVFADVIGPSSLAERILDRLKKAESSTNSSDFAGFMLEVDLLSIMLISETFRRYLEIIMNSQRI